MAVHRKRNASSGVIRVPRRPARAKVAPAGFEELVIRSTRRAGDEAEAFGAVRELRERADRVRSAREQLIATAIIETHGADGAVGEIVARVRERPPIRVRQNLRLVRLTRWWCLDRRETRLRGAGAQCNRTESDRRLKQPAPFVSHEVQNNSFP